MLKGTGRKAILSLLTLGTLLFSASISAEESASIGANLNAETLSEYARGPDPSVRFLEQRRGPFNVRSSDAPSLVDGFGGGTVYYPTDASGTMAAIVVIPGFVSPESSIRWWGPKLASHGFVVMTIDTNSGFDQPGSRARQINNALDFLLEQNNSGGSSISGMIDPERLGVVGWSMGGGGTLRVATQGRIDAAIPLAPWDTSASRFRDNQTPTLIFACSLDFIAPVGSHARPFYNRIPDSTPKAFVELSGGTHYCANGGNRYNDVLSRLGVSWMKFHLDQDDRYEQFLCGSNPGGIRQVSRYRGNCPY